MAYTISTAFIKQFESEVKEIKAESVPSAVTTGDVEESSIAKVRALEAEEERIRITTEQILQN